MTKKVELDMKSWELTSVCINPLRAVLEAVERSQIQTPEKSIVEIEESLLEFVEKVKEIKSALEQGKVIVTRDEAVHQFESGEGSCRGPCDDVKGTPV